ncbi:Oidioi.mRNA.OKI2018_I69.PAR.g9755.t1.cds [Oikopleura dioica]|uniref:Oidioi.mRNA.OKI2018_I69.PAR.g9755.t1.cds n=1 Tax=Oikopleura dioica TaxID=34765 RepID=A0ABN7RPZ6_OIKDI|nr:Oidioi.mRNA.OKI2018_I69.PAR.g9755.t1.cds [Oikopleura dioica]
MRGIGNVEKLKKYLVCLWVAAMIILVVIIGFRIVDADIILDQSWYMLILMISLCTTVIAILLEGPVQRYLNSRPPPVSLARQYGLSRRAARPNNREDVEIDNRSDPPSYLSSILEDRSLIPFFQNMQNIRFHETFHIPVFEAPPTYEECNVLKDHEDEVDNEDSSEIFSV